MNRNEYRRFMACTRKVMRNTLERLSELTSEFCLTDEMLRESIGLCDTITALSRLFYGREEISLVERRAFENMYRG